MLVAHKHFFLKKCRVVCGDGIPQDSKNCKALHFLKDVIQIIAIFTVPPPVYIKIFS